jgi:hypothetical protein
MVSGEINEIHTNFCPAIGGSSSSKSTLFDILCSLFVLRFDIIV